MGFTTENLKVNYITKLFLRKYCFFSFQIWHDSIKTKQNLTMTFQKVYIQKEETTMLTKLIRCSILADKIGWYF